MRAAVVLALVALTGCSGPAVVEKAPELHALAADESALFPIRDRQATRVVPSHLMNQAFMPGGTVGDYSDGKTQYQLFATRLPSADKAAFLLLDWKKALPDAKYLAHMGGYYGTFEGKPIYVFAKRDLLAGVAGLPQDKADVIAREFAARLK